MKQQHIYIQISAGRGPAECAWVVAQVLRELLAFAKHEGIIFETINRSQGQEPSTINSCLVKLTGKKVKEVVEPWVGTVQWIGKSPYRKFHKRKNWFVGVSVFDETSEVSFDEKDLVYSTFRGSGPGGQHRNKVETAVRVKHIPTQISATATDSKSQLQNKKAALAKLKLAMEQHRMDMLQTQVDEQWREHLSLQRGNPVKVFEGRNFKEKQL